MKLIIAIIHDSDSQKLNVSFVQNNIRATKLSSTGGFLKEGNTTFLLGVSDEDVDHVLEVIKNTAKTRKVMYNPGINAMSTAANGISPMIGDSEPSEISVSGATVFVIDVDKFVRF